MQLFPGYSEADATIFGEFINPRARAEPGYIVDFLGSRIRTTSVWKQARLLDGQLAGLPIPGDFHAEAIEWIGLLKAVRSAFGQYVAMELGAGFGPWSVAGGLAARLRGIQNIRLCAVEGDTEHFQFLQQHFADNRFDPREHALFQAAVGTTAGTAQWPVPDNLAATESWGCRPIHDSADQVRQQFGSTREVNVIPMRDLVMREVCWDLIHIDVQGDEVEICRSCIDEINARVRWIIVGTHSRKIDGDFLDLMWRSGWLLEHEKPAKFNFLQGTAALETMTVMDGTQVWRNPRLICAGEPLSSFSQEIVSETDELRLKSGETYALDITVRNTGTQSWHSGGETMTVAAGYRLLDSEGRMLPMEGERTQLNSSIVEPGQSESLKLRIAGPRQPGSYAIWVSMVQEGVNWFFDRNAKPLVLRVTVV